MPLLAVLTENWIPANIAAAKVGFDMGIPFNELNRVFDLGFKPLPWGDDGYLPANLQKVGTTTRTPNPRRSPESL